MKLKITSLLILSCLIPLAGWTQMQMERFSSEYTFIGKGTADNSKNASFQEYNLAITFPKRIKNSPGAIFHKFSYGNTQIDYALTPVATGEIENFHTISYTLGYSKPLKKGWFLTAFVSPNISSNFDASIQWDELNLFGMALFTKAINQKRNLFLGLGAIYSNTLGFPAPIPIANLMWKPNAKWTINFGFPRLDVNYKINNNSLIGSNLLVSGNNFTLSKDIAVNGSETNIDNIRVMNIGGGLYWHQKLGKKLKLKLNTGYTFYRNFEFENGKNKVLDFELDNNFYVKFGLSLGI